MRVRTGEVYKNQQSGKIIKVTALRRSTASRRDICYVVNIDSTGNAMESTNRKITSGTIERHYELI